MTKLKNVRFSLALSAGPTAILSSGGKRHPVRQ
jgi:hypothetical protein